MATSVLEGIVADTPIFVRRINVDELHRMLAQGVIYDGDPVELIDGLLVYKDRRDAGGKPMSHGPRHATTVENFRDLETVVKEHGFTIRAQLPVTLSDVSEPEPDGAIVVGTRGDYSDRHPRPSDIQVVIEVSDTSLKHDQTKKQRVSQPILSNCIKTPWLQQRGTQSTHRSQGTTRFDSGLALR